MKVNSYYPVLCIANIQETTEFYKEHFGFKPVFENDWYNHLQMKNNESVNLAIVASDHASVPEAYRKQAQGVLLNFEMEEVDKLYNKFKEIGLNILLDLRDEPWGQRHFILSDPSGVMVDVIKLIEPSEEFKAQYNQ